MFGIKLISTTEYNLLKEKYEIYKRVSDYPWLGEWGFLTPFWRYIQNGRDSIENVRNDCRILYKKETKLFQEYIEKLEKYLSVTKEKNRALETLVDITRVDLKKECHHGNKPSCKECNSEAILKFICRHDLFGEIFWDENLEYYINCNDLFFWGCADTEDLTKEDIPELEECLKITKNRGYGLSLFCARKRKMRPQEAYYKHIPEHLWEKFDICGPERKRDIGNPKERK